MHVTFLLWPNVIIFQVGIITYGEVVLTVKQDTVLKTLAVLKVYILVLNVKILKLKCQKFCMTLFSYCRSFETMTSLLDIAHLPYVECLCGTETMPPSGVTKKKDTNCLEELRVGKRRAQQCIEL